MPKSVFAPKLPVPVPSRIETVSPLAFATARSSLPSPLKSPTATEFGLAARAEVGLRPKAARARAQQNRDGVAITVRHRQIELAIAIEIAHRD